MTVRTMRMVDRFVGIPLCFLVAFIARLLPEAGRRETSKPWKTVLVIKFFGMGSVLLSSSFLQALRAGVDARIVYLTFRNNEPVLERLPGVALRLSISTASPWRFTRDTISVIKILRSSQPDAVFDLEFFSKFSTLLSRLSGAPRRIGFTLPARWRTLNLTHPVPLNHEEHITKAFLSQLAPFGLLPDELPPVIALSPTDEESSSMQRKLNIRPNGVPLICVNINAGPTSIERRWSPTRFLDVVSELLSELPAARFYMIGSVGDRAYVEHALRQSSPALVRACVNCAGLLSLGELLALFKISSLLLTNDSGPMHLASSVGLPLVSLFGPESPSFYGPLTSRGIVIYKKMSCSPCLSVYAAKSFKCPYNARCMGEIEAAEVVCAAKKMLNEEPVTAT